MRSLSSVDSRWSTWLLLMPPRACEVRCSRCFLRAGKRLPSADQAGVLGQRARRMVASERARYHDGTGSSSAENVDNGFFEFIEVDKKDICLRRLVLLSARDFLCFFVTGAVYNMLKQEADWDHESTLPSTRLSHSASAPKGSGAAAGGLVRLNMQLQASPDTILP